MATQGTAGIEMLDFVKGLTRSRCQQGWRRVSMQFGFSSRARKNGVSAACCSWNKPSSLLENTRIHNTLLGRIDQRCLISLLGFETIVNETKHNKTETTVASACPVSKAQLLWYCFYFGFGLLLAQSPLYFTFSHCNTTVEARETKACLYIIKRMSLIMWSTY